MLPPRWPAYVLLRILHPEKETLEGMPFPSLRTLHLHLDPLWIPDELSSILNARHTRGCHLERIAIQYTLPRATGPNPELENQILRKKSKLEELVAELREKLECEVDAYEVEDPPAFTLPEICNTECSQYWPPWIPEASSEEV